MEENSQFSEVYRIITFFVITVMSIVLSIFLFQVRWLFYIFAVLSFLCVVAVMFDFTVRRLTRLTHTPISQHGNVAQSMPGKVKTFAPLAINAPRGAEKPAKIVPVIPTVKDMLAQDLLDGINLYHGFTIVKEEVQPHVGTFNDVRTFAIAGKGGSGKTIRLFFLLLQCVLARATIFLCDPHGDDTGSITGLLQPLARWVRFAVRDFEHNIEGQVMQEVVAFRDVMERRVHGDKDRSPQVLVIDEFNRMVNHPEYGEIVVDVVCNCATQYRKFGGYAIVIAQEWSAPGKGKVMNLFSRLRNDLHAVFIHRLNPNYAKFFTRDAKLLKRVDHLKTGLCFFFDANGEFHELHTPIGTIADAFTVARMMSQIEAPEEYAQLARPGVQVSPAQRPFYHEQIAQHAMKVEPETESFQPDYSAQSSLPKFAEVQVQNEIRQPVEQSAVGNGFSMKSELQKAYSEEDESKMLNAYLALSKVKGPEGVQRKDILEQCGWTNYKWSVVKAFCDARGIGK